MRSDQPTHLSSLSLVLPHPPLPRRTSSIRSFNEHIPSPRTPPRTSIGLSSPGLFKLDSGLPRRSTDSWNSSVHDGGEDDMEWEWTTEQLALLNKTLDALPSHLLSPFNGSVPPVNILDKISRSIIHAKDPLEWPHSIRSTRIKLLNLARGRSEGRVILDRKQSSDSIADVLQPTTNVPKKPLYRQSSMDFLKGNTLKNERNIDRLSSRLQRIDRFIPNPACAYERNTSCTPPLSQRRPLSMGEPPQTPGTPTPDDNVYRGLPSSFSASRGSKLRRSMTTAQGLPPIPSEVASDHTSAERPAVACVLKVKRSESFSSPNFGGLGHSLKRAPSYGSVSSRMSLDDQKENSPHLAVYESMLDIYPSTDDEEKIRSNKVKKAKTADNLPAERTRPARKANAMAKTPSSATLKAGRSATPKKDGRPRKIPSKKISRTASMFGAELPNPQPEPLPPTPHVELPSPEHMFVLSDENMEPLPATPDRRLRRVKTTNFPTRLKRRISFGHLSAPAETSESEATGAGLECAIQLD